NIPRLERLRCLFVKGIEPAGLLALGDRGERRLQLAVIHAVFTNQIAIHHNLTALHSNRVTFTPRKARAGLSRREMRNIEVYQITARNCQNKRVSFARRMTRVPPKTSPPKPTAV